MLQDNAQNIYVGGAPVQRIYRGGTLLWELPSSLSAPTNVSADPFPDSGWIGINWDSVTGATAYRVYRGTTSGGPYDTLVADTSETDVIDNNASYDTDYYYVVEAYNDSETGPQSAEVLERITAATPSALQDVTIANEPDAPTNFEVVETSSHNVALSGDFGSAVTEARIYRNGSELATVDVSGGSISYTDNTVAEDTQYTYVLEVRASFSAWSTRPSDVTITTDLVTPASLQDVTLTLPYLATPTALRDVTLILPGEVDPASNATVAVSPQTADPGTQRDFTVPELDGISGYSVRYLDANNAEVGGGQPVTDETNAYLHQETLYEDATTIDVHAEVTNTSSGVTYTTPITTVTVN